MTKRALKMISISLASAALAGCVATMPGASGDQSAALTPEAMKKMNVPRAKGASVLLAYVRDKLNQPGMDDQAFVDLTMRIGPQLEREVSALRASGKEIRSKENVAIIEKYRNIIGNGTNGEVYEYFNVEMGSYSRTATYDPARGGYVWEGEIGGKMVNDMPRPPNFKEYEGYIGMVDMTRRKMRIVAPVAAADRKEEVYAATQKGTPIIKKYLAVVHYKPTNCTIKEERAASDTMQCSITVLGSSVFEANSRGERGQMLPNAAIEIM